MRTLVFTLQLIFMFLAVVPAQAEIITFDNPDLSGWYTDRRAPADFQTNSFDGDSRLQIDIIGSETDSNSFYNYQGKKKDFNADISNFAIVGDLFVNSAWTDSNVGIWGTLIDSSNSVSGYPIVAWRSSSTGAFASGFYAFDYYAGGWITLGTSYTPDSWYSIMMRYTGSTMDYYINNELKYSFADTWQDGVIGNIILNSYNFGSDFTVYWDNVGVAPVPEPGTATLLGMGLLGLAGYAARRKR